jgi:Co/Zn/Cd efflux system component
MKKFAFAAAIFALPMVAFAQTPTNLVTLINLAGTVLNMLIPILIAAALVVFFIGLVQYIWKKKGGKDIMIAGLVGLFVMVSVWGIIRLAQNTLGVNNSTSIPVPQVSPNYVH